MAAPESDGTVTGEQQAAIDRARIDQAAAQHASTIETPEPMPATPILAYGASGEHVTKLVDLLALLGYTTNDVLAGKSHTLDESVLVDVRAAQQALGVAEAPYPLELAGETIEGELVGATTWDALYAAAQAKLQEPAA